MTRTPAPAGFTPGSTAEILATGQQVSVLSRPRFYRPQMPSAQRLGAWVVDVRLSGRAVPLACELLDPVRHTDLGGAL